jgi:Ca2+-binding RTX toxin-like protein
VLTFQPGETLHVLRFPVLDNLVAEPTESFSLNLFGPTGGALIGTSSVAGAILDNDGPPVANLTNNGTGNADVLVGRPGANAVAGLGGNDLLDGVNGVSMNGGSGNDVYIVESASDLVSESGGSGTDTVVAYVDHTLGAGLENLLLRGSAVNGTGNTANNTVQGHGGTNVLNGKAGADVLSGGGGTNTFVFDSTVGGFDTVTDWISANDTLRFSMATLPVGDNDALVEGGLVRAAPGGFATSAEVVIFTTNIVGSITTATAAATIGSALTPYAAGADVLFAVDNGTQTGVFRFVSSGADAVVSAAELTQVALLNGSTGTALVDYTFAP